MRLVSMTGIRVAVLLAVVASAGAASSVRAAQEPDGAVPTFAASAEPVPVARPAEREKAPAATVRLLPVSIAGAYVGHAVPAGGFARVIPPAPRIVTRVVSQPAGSVALRVNSGFGFRRDPIDGSGRMHTGIDVAAGYGDSVGAALGGKVVFAGYRGGYGNLVILDHGQGIATYYAHLLNVAVNVGQYVVPGQSVGLAGSTGRSTGPHLHYEVRANGVPIDPSAVITFKGKQILANGGVVSGKAIDGGDEEVAAKGTAAKPMPPERPVPLFQSGDTLSNY